MKPVKILYVCDPAKAGTCRKAGCRQNPYSAYPVCEWTDKPEWAKTDATGNPIIDWENTLFLLKQDILWEVPPAVPYKYTARIEQAAGLAAIALGLGFVEAVVLAILMLV